MICKHCGKTVLDDSLFCQYCGVRFVDIAEDTSIKIEAENPTTPQYSELASAGRVRYCQKCGGVVDPETKKCTKCGKQYFKFPTSMVRKGIIALLFLAMAGGLVYLYTENQALTKEYKKTAETASEKEKISAQLVYDIGNIEQKAEEEYRFYNKHAVIVQPGDSYYHSFLCPNLDYGYFWIYNTNAAIDSGYEPCPDCQ